MESCLITFQEFQQKFNLNGLNFLLHMQCIQAVRTFLRKNGIVIENMNSSDVSYVQRVLFSCHRGSRLYYDLLLPPPIRVNSADKWETKLNCIINWKDVFSAVHKIKEIRFKWFQIRVIHRILGTNICLKSMNLRQNDFCSFCNQDRESILHLLSNCNIVKDFLNVFKACLISADIVQENFTFSPMLMLFGLSEDYEMDETLAYVILILRFFVYKCRCEGSVPTMPAFQHYLHRKYLVDQQIARQNQKSLLFEQNWVKWQTILR